MTLEEGKEAFETARDAWETGDWDAFDAAHAESVVVFSPLTPEPTKGREAHQAALKGIRGAFPDAKVEETGIFGAGDWICAEQVITGTNTGPLKGPRGEEISPTNKPVRIEMLTVGRIVNGEIAEEHVYFDNLGFQAQLGLMPEEWGILRPGRDLPLIG